jgi:outer membrane cobalamin receptor
VNHKQVIIRWVFLQVIFSLLFLYPTSVYAQKSSRHTVSGWISDEIGDPLIGATISIKNVDTFIVVLSDQKGYFKYRSFQNSSYEIVVSHIGFKSYVKLINAETQQLKIKMEPSTKELDQVVVSTGKTNTEIKRTTVSTEIIKPYLIENKGVVNMEAIMNQLPSVNAIDGQVNIRSGSGWSYGAGSRVLILVDDMPYIAGDAGQVQWKFIPLENIGQMEVIKGASSVLFGSAALNGVINIKTAKPSTKPKSQITFQQGFYAKLPDIQTRWTTKQRGQTMLSAFHSERIYNTDVLAALNIMSDLGYRLGEDDQRLRLTLKANHRNQKVTGLRYGIATNFMQQISSSFLLWDAYTSRYTSLDSNKTGTQARLFSIDPHISYQTARNKHILKLRVNGSINSVENTISLVNQSNQFRNRSYEYQFQRILNKRNSVLNAGLMYATVKSESELYAGNHTMKNFAPYVQLELRFRKIDISAGWRYENYQMDNTSDNANIFRIGTSFEFTKTTFLRASFGQGFRFPTIAERYITTSVGLVNIYPNEKLQAERGWSSEFGLKQGFRVGENWSGYIDAAYFVQEYQNMIEFAYGIWDTFNINIPNSWIRSSGFKAFNVGKTRISGVDASLGADGKLTDDFRLRLLVGYTYANPVSITPDYVFATDEFNTAYSYRSTSEDPENTQLKYRYNHLFKLDVEITYKRLLIGVSQRYNSYMTNMDGFFTDPTSPLNIQYQNMDIDKGRNMNLQGDIVFDIRLGYTFSKKLSAMFIVNNLTNHEQMARPADMRPPRMFIFQLKYAFR